MRYYVVSDPHGFFSPLRAGLKKAGYFSDTEPRRLIVLGDVMDRGREAVKMQNFLVKELEAGRLILVRGNHEDLFCELLGKDHGMPYSHHVHNGTLDTVVQLSHSRDAYPLDPYPEEARQKIVSLLAGARRSDYNTKLIPASVDYYETGHYVFVHGWIPMVGTAPLADWRNGDSGAWNEARWLNGPVNARFTDIGKTVVCGHWSAYDAHCRFEGKPNLRPLWDHTPYYGKGVICLDSCTVLSRKVYCIVLED